MILKMIHCPIIRRKTLNTPFWANIFIYYIDSYIPCCNCCITMQINFFTFTVDLALISK